ncbi:tetratricopeptide repeat protein [Prochlorothrix hollandica]|uniref:tetratricopeptide repeat protein n=1 Tax=Prochlorothrix hollandica TaxID=1223 RepID=UPI000344AE83|nr:tetratricopeptide repeat protein [Prochlorothrix hollandica]
MADKTIAATNDYNLWRLMVAMRASYGKLNLLVATCDQGFYRDRLIQSYEAELGAGGTQCHQVRLDRDSLSLRQTLEGWQAQHPQGLNPPAVVTVLGADGLLGVRLGDAPSDQERFAFSAQWTREALRGFAVPLVLWLRPETATLLASVAPDFWSWRGGVFEFSAPTPLPTATVAQPREFSPPAAPAESTPDGPDPVALLQEIHALETQDPQSPLLAGLYTTLAGAYVDRCQQGKAEDYRQELHQALTVAGHAVALHEAANSGTGLATALNRYARSYELLGRYPEAEPLYGRALAICEQELGANHPDTATSLNNLALLYKSMGRYEEALPLYQRSLAIREQELGANHPDTATSLNNLAVLYESMGRYEEALPLYQRSLAIYEQELGASHPDTASTLNNLAALYESMGRYEEALPLYERAVEIATQVLGPTHPNTQTFQENLQICQNQMP